MPSSGIPTASPLEPWPASPRPCAKKIPLHRQLANLLIQRSQLRLVRLAMPDRSLVPRKQRRRAVQQRLLPGVDLAGMHTKPARQLGNRAILPDRCQRHFRLELRTVLLPCSRQVSPPAKPPSQGKTLSYQPVQFSGTTSVNAAKYWLSTHGGPEWRVIEGRRIGSLEGSPPVAVSGDAKVVVFLP